MTDILVNIDFLFEFSGEQLFSFQREKFESGDLGRDKDLQQTFGPHRGGILPFEYFQ